jgi:hypothetical protein
MLSAPPVPPAACTVDSQIARRATGYRFCMLLVGEGGQYRAGRAQPPMKPSRISTRPLSGGTAVSPNPSCPEDQGSGGLYPSPFPITNPTRFWTQRSLLSPAGMRIPARLRGHHAVFRPRLPCRPPTQVLGFQFCFLASRKPPGSQVPQIRQQRYHRGVGTARKLLIVRRLHSHRGLGLLLVQP